MKRIIAKTSLVFFALAISCSDSFFEKLPPASASASQFYNEKGIDYLLIGAYSLLEGVGATSDGTAYYFDAEYYVGGAGSNWLFGDVRAGDAAKGSDDYDQASAGLIERFQIQPTSGQVGAKWRVNFDGVSRCNDVLKAIANTTEASEAFLTLRTAEARFLRAHYYFELKKSFNNIPWIDENTTDYKQPNDQSVWPQIEADFEFAAANLPVTQTEAGRATSGAAKAYLAKAYIFQQKWTASKPLLDGIIGSGLYSLNPCFRDAFDMLNKNSAESLFAAQNIVNDGTPESENGNWGEVLNHPLAAIEGQCCGFYQPSYDLVNSFQTNASGLPLLDTYQVEEVKNDFYPTVVSPNDPFSPDNGTFDPRLDWTTGRRGIPYLDWGVHPGSPWIRNSSYGGPYLPKKRNFTKEEAGTGSTQAGWALGPNSANIDFIRYADVLLWAAEVEIEIGDLEKARDYINQVRARTKNGCMVMEIEEDGSPTSTPAANYSIEEYPGPWADKAFATKALRFERRLELAMEGHRFFDLVRWGIASDVINGYLEKEVAKRPLALADAVFVEGKHEYLPIPESEIINTSKNGEPVLTQNPGY